MKNDDTHMLTREEALAGRRWYVIDARRTRCSGASRSEVANAAARQGQADLHAARRLRRLRRRGQRRAGAAHRAEGTDKIYYRHSGYPGRHSRADAPAGCGASASGAAAAPGGRPACCRRTALAGSLATKLKIYAGAEHPHAAQQPAVVDLPAAGAGVSMAERTATHRGHRQAEDGRGARPARCRATGKISRQPTHARRVLRPSDVAHDRQPAVRAHRHQGAVRCRRQRGGRRRLGAGVGDPARHHARADRREPGASGRR